MIEKIRTRNPLIVINKCDLPNKIDQSRLKKIFQNKKILEISALKKISIDSLENAIVESVWQGNLKEVPRVVISNARHMESLKNCASVLEKAHESLAQNLPLELTSEQIKTAVAHLDNITGRNVDSDLIDKIFSEFCIGK